MGAQPLSLLTGPVVGGDGNKPADDAGRLLQGRRPAGPLVHLGLRHEQLSN